MLKHRYISIFLIVGIVLLGYFIYSTQNPDSKYAFKLGLDLAGGTELTYKADISQAKGGDIAGAMSTLRDVIERRVNIFGVSEPVIQAETAGGLSGATENHLVVDLPGVTDVTAAEAMIGQTPDLEFDLLTPAAQKMTPDELAAASSSTVFLQTGLNGTMLNSASLQFG